MFWSNFCFGSTKLQRRIHFWSQQHDGVAFFRNPAHFERNNSIRIKRGPLFSCCLRVTERTVLRRSAWDVGRGSRRSGLRAGGCRILWVVRAPGSGGMRHGMNRKQPWFLLPSCTQVGRLGELKMQHTSTG